MSALELGAGTVQIIRPVPAVVAEWVRLKCQYASGRGDNQRKPPVCVAELCARLESENMTWALIGSTSFALKGVPV